MVVIDLGGTHLRVSHFDEAGPHPGPDFIHGWGLANGASAARLMGVALPGLEEPAVLLNNIRDELTADAKKFGDARGFFSEVYSRPALAAAGVAFAGQAAADEALAKAKNCMSCHAIDKKVVGPAWADVAKKYHGDAGAAAMLDAKVKNGGKGNWGSMAMPAQPKLSDADRKELITFILGL